MKRRAILGLGLVAFLAPVACDKDEDHGKGEDLTIVVEADRSKLSEEEEKLRTRQAAFEEERKRLREEKAKLMSEKGQLQDKDKTAARRLAEMEKRLWEKERSMWSKEASIEKGRQHLAKSKSDLLLRAASGGLKGTAAGSTIASREGAIVKRERTFAKRESDLAGREKDLAEREAALARREAEFLKLQAKLSTVRMPAVARVAPSEGRVNRKEAEKAFKAVSRKMRSRGILWADLPPEMAGLEKEFYAAKKAGDFGRAKDQVTQLEAVLSAMVIDAGFIDRKFARLNALIKKKPPKDKQAISTSLRKATRLYGDGSFKAANRELNRIFALLTR